MKWFWDYSNLIHVPFLQPSRSSRCSDVRAAREKSFVGPSRLEGSLKKNLAVFIEDYIFLGPPRTAK